MRSNPVAGWRPSWLLVLVMAVALSSAAAAAAWFLTTPEFVAFAILRVAEREPRLIFATTDNSHAVDFEIYKRTQRELMRSRFVLDAALRSPDVERLPAVRNQVDAVTWLENRVYIDFPGEGEIMRISFSDPDAETAAAITNAVTKAYVREVVDIERRHRMDRLVSLEKVFNDAEEKMRAKQADLKRLAGSVGTGDGAALSARQQDTMQHFAILRNEHLKIHLELLRAKLTLAEAGEKAEDNAGLTHKVAVLTVLEKVVHEEVEKFSKQAEAIDRSSIEIEMLRSELKQVEKLSTDLGSEIEFLRVELRSPSRITELQPADVPITADTFVRIRNTILAALCGFLTPPLAMGLIGVGSWWRRRSSRRAARSAGAATTDSSHTGRDEILDAIERLADLQAKGIVSADEFEAKKAELLSRV